MGTHLLTARQAEVWEMNRKQGLNLREIADRLGIRPQSASVALKGALRKLTAGKVVPEEQAGLELDTPAERLARLFKVLELATADPSDASTVKLAQELRARCLAMADNQVLAQTSGPGLMNMASGATNIIQLLQGKPTAIMKHQDMRKLDEFLDAVSKELRARGEGPEVIDVTPEEEEEEDG